MEANEKRITVVLSTRNRGAAAAEAVRTILANKHPDFEAIVVDQGDGDVTRKSLEPFLNDPRFRYLKSTGRGRAAGLNAGIREARGALVLTTDDDCTVPQNWLQEFEAAFASNLRIGIAFGNVVPASHDPAAGCIPAYIRTKPFLARGFDDKLYVEGIGACMAIRKSVWQALQGFDEMLGAGARFQAGEDGDLALRALLAGYWIYETPAVYVTHHGLRTWAELPNLIDGYWYGTGALLAKPLRMHRWGMLLLLVRLGSRWAFGRSTVAASLGQRPEKLRRLRAFCRGFLAGAFCPLDKRTGHYT
jgi:GT2 family glycosyltransferase